MYAGADAAGTPTFVGENHRRPGPMCVTLQMFFDQSSNGFAVAWSA